MQRHPALQGLSREHHSALALGRALQTDTAGSFDAGLPSEPAARVAEIQQRVQQQLVPHFALEERELWPLSLCGDPALRRHAQAIQEQHAEIRGLAAGLEPGTLATQGNALGRALTDHVRFEERSWFPALEASLQPPTLERLRLRLQPQPQARIVAFSQEEAGVWVAQLECGHSRHVRHEPPFKLAAWVTEASERAQRIGTALTCALCRMPPLPACASVYKTSPEFDAASVPAGLRRSHRLKAATWARIEVIEGRVSYTLEDEQDLTLVLRPGVPGTVAPERPHHITPQPGARLRIEFLRV